VVPLELPAYQRKETWGAGETFYQIVRTLALPHAPEPGSPGPSREPGETPRCNILGPCGMGFRHRDDVREVRGLLDALGIEVATVAPLGASPDDVARLGEAHFNVVLYPEIADVTARWLKRTFRQPMTTTVPIGVGATREFVEEVAELAGVDPAPGLDRVERETRLPWYSRSVDSTYLTGKRVFVFGDATHAVAAARVASEELGFEVVGLGCYNREFAREIRRAAKVYGVDPLITDDYLEVEAAIEEAAPELVLGTQMERHIAKKLGLFCAVISAPTHVQDFPARYAPQMGPEGANVLFDTWVHPLIMGLEEHLLVMFKDDFEFGDGSVPSHLASEAAVKGRPEETRTGGASPAVQGSPAEAEAPAAAPTGAPAATLDPVPTPSGEPTWTDDAEAELRKIPFFVRKKARRNTERYAREQGLERIEIDTLYEAKAHFSRAGRG
jgi:light-independent protochlorophyllide reductase subunit B